ncbi:dihydroorotate dehydrogenase electron transfer subunit, partial [Candidatus Woesearchaeota archaeon]|nr:dihydroorotate dehydrogenase electron transfer subunit [Candidatus Woesearchaeota archaeon]
PYTIRGKNLTIIGGGCGCAPTAFLADTARRMGKKVDFIIGARTSKALLFTERMKRSGIRTHISTDDGTAGRRGYATDLLRDLLQKQKVDSVYTCGPEVMMKIVVDMCLQKRIYCEASLERYMKCGFGVCGQCCLDQIGLRVCKEGPVFTGRQLSKIKEFGSHRRDATGRKVKL